MSRTTHVCELASPLHLPARVAIKPASALVETPTLSSLFVGRLIEHASRRVDSHDLHRLTGVSPLHDDAALRVSLQGYLGLWATLMQTTRNSSLPIELAEAISIDDFQVLGYLVMTSANGHEAVMTLFRYLGLLTEGGAWSIEAGDELHLARWQRTSAGGGTTEQRAANEFAVAQYVRILRQIGHHSTPVEVTFRHPRPPRTAAHERFFQCPIAWSAPIDSVRLDPRSLQFRPPLANPGLHAFLQAQADEILVARAGMSLEDQIRSAIIGELPSGPPPLSRVARRLAMSERSLRRTLHRDQQSFRQIVEHVRKARAIEMLQAGTTSVGEIATMLGYSDPSAFSRAFKRWCGRSPQSFARTA